MTVIDDPGYYEHLRQEVRLTFTHLLAAITIYTVIVGASSFRITEEQFLATVLLVIGSSIVIFLLDLLALGFCRRHINKKIRQAYSDQLRPERVDIGSVMDTNRLDRVSINAVRVSIAALYLLIFLLLIRYTLYVPTESGRPPSPFTWVAVIGIFASMIAVVIQTIEYKPFSVRVAQVIIKRIRGKYSTARRKLGRE